MNVLFAIQRYLDREPLGFVIFGPGVILRDHDLVVPDVLFVSNERLGEIASGEYITGAPDLVVEVLFPGTENERRDRYAKKQLYGKYGVKEFWLANPQDRTVEVYVLDGNALKLSLTADEQHELVSSILTGFHCEIDPVFAI